MNTVIPWGPFIVQYGYAAVFVLGMVEGPVVTIFAGFLASRGILGIGPVYIAAVAGDLVGDLVCYALGRWFFAVGMTVTGGAGLRLQKHVNALTAYIQLRAGRVLLFGKLTQSAGYPVLIAAGAARVRIISFVAYNTLGTVPKVAAFIALGYFFGRYYQSFAGGLNIAGIVGFMLICGIGVPLLVRRVSVQGSRGGLP